MAQRYKRIDLTGFSPEQRHALIEVQRRLKETAAQRQEMADAARAAFAATVQAPTWNIVEGQYPLKGLPPQDAAQHWNVGAPKVNYVDHIEGIDDDG